tara:strand:- start:31 stop:918 length:888 start_codon:yes stop_codon:yes gene_type:complete
MSLFETFKKAIETATTNMSDYKKAAKEYTDEVDSGLDTLAKLIKRLSVCIKQLVSLQDDYISYIQRITQIRENMEIMLNREITQAQTDSGKDCDKKISDLLKQFQGFVQTIGTWEKEGTRFETLLAELKTEIDTLCKKAEQIMMQNQGNKGGLEREISELEAKLGQERGASKKNADDEQKQSYVERQARAMEEGDTERAEEEARRRSASMDVQRRQQLAEQESIARQEAARANRRGSEGGLPGYDQVGGWQTPQKLESISRYSPIRRVTRKKKNKKKKKKRRKKQTKKRRGKKRN